ncbi:unnamed protein product [Candidula unifasciata]|uniref:G-protein coupled receptors family 1 profile domain-containing protein n=1 Tax=Candidula unifasciata TaxID=100452 RepID=A0A8S3ZK43_9EUPU|nr:unnamed protein product [Candidula unifasciata]
MSENVHSNCSDCDETEQTSGTLLSEELAYTIHQSFQYVLLPCFSLLGIAGNVTSIVLLTRQGFRKCSNILLLALAVSDILFLIGVNNFPLYVYNNSVPPGFQFSAPVNYIFYIMWLAFMCARTIGIQTAMCIPVLITGERILAILCPLKVYFIITRRRTVITVSILYALNGVYFIYRLILSLQLKHFIVQGISLSRIVYTDLYRYAVESGLYGLLEHIVNYVTGIIPICLVTIGCVIIGTQITVVTNKRKTLTLRQAKSTNKHLISKTTKTLFSICVLYIFCSGFAFAIGYLATFTQVAQDLPLTDLLGSVEDLLLCINCIGDFVIYVGANNRFRKSRKFRF